MFQAVLLWTQRPYGQLHCWWSVTKAMTAVNDEFTVIHMGKGIFESISQHCGFVAAKQCRNLLMKNFLL